MLAPERHDDDLLEVGIDVNSILVVPCSLQDMHKLWISWMGWSSSDPWDHFKFACMPVPSSGEPVFSTALPKEGK